MHNLLQPNGAQGNSLITSDPKDGARSYCNNVILAFLFGAGWTALFLQISWCFFLICNNFWQFPLCSTRSDASFQVIMNYLLHESLSPQSRGKPEFDPPHPANDGMYMRMQWMHLNAMVQQSNSWGLGHWSRNSQLLPLDLLETPWRKRVLWCCSESDFNADELYEMLKGLEIETRGFCYRLVWGRKE